MDAPRYSRLSRYAPLGTALPRWQAAHCAVVGVGGLGGGLMQQLARFGVKRLVLIDRDVVGAENLGHQSLFTPDDVGVPKAVAAAELARRINPDVQVEAQVGELTRQNIDALLDGVELIFDGLDNYYTRLLLNDYSRSRGVPYFYAGVVRGELSARAVVPGVAGCLRCVLDAPPAPGEAPTCAAEGVFPPLLGVANALQLDAATRWLGGSFTTADDMLYSFSLPGWDLRRLPLGGPRAGCPACGGRYEYLDGTLDSLAASACSPDRAEAQLAPLDLGLLAQQLTDSGDGWELRRSSYCLVAARDGLRYTLFPQGKVVQEGSADPVTLRRFVATWLGA